jgi:hypothetical protein
MMRAMSWIVVAFMLWQGIFVIHAQESSFVEVSVDKANPYIGEVIAYQIRFFDDGRATDIQLLLPDFQALGQIGESDVTQRTEQVNGVGFTVFEQTIYLVSNNIGNIEIAPVRVEIPETVFQDGVVLESNIVALSVKALPEEARDAQSVGRYAVSVNTNATALEVGDLLRLEVSISGTGYLQGIAPPVFAEDDVSNIWQVVSQTPVYRLETPTRGEKVFVWDMVALRSGEHRLVFEDWVIFDPEQAQVERLVIPPISINIIGENNQGAMIVATDTPRENNALLVDWSWRDIEATTFNLPLWVMVLLWFLPMIVFLFAMVAGLSQLSQRQIKTPRSHLLKRLNTLAKTEDPKFIHAEVEILLLDYVAERLNEPIDEDVFEMALDKLPEKEALYVYECWHHVEQARYAPVDDEDADWLIRQVRRLLKRQSQ